MNIELEPTNDPNAERAVLDVFRLLLENLDAKPGDNPVDESSETRYSMS